MSSCGGVNSCCPGGGNLKGNHGGVFGYGFVGLGDGSGDGVDVLSGGVPEY
jgi:hypothetical protein